MSTTLTYYVTRYGMSPIDSGTRRYYLDSEGQWTPNRDKAVPFETREQAQKTAKRFPGSFVDGFRKD